jgi:hypothetical protein
MRASFKLLCSRGNWCHRAVAAGCLIEIRLPDSAFASVDDFLGIRESLG